MDYPNSSSQESDTQQQQGTQPRSKILLSRDKSKGKQSNARAMQMHLDAEMNELAPSDDYIGANMRGVSPSRSGLKRDIQSVGMRGAQRDTSSALDKNSQRMELRQDERQFRPHHLASQADIPIQSDSPTPGGHQMSNPYAESKTQFEHNNSMVSDPKFFKHEGEHSDLKLSKCRTSPADRPLPRPAAPKRARCRLPVVRPECGVGLPQTIQFDPAQRGFAGRRPLLDEPGDFQRRNPALQVRQDQDPERAGRRLQHGDEREHARQDRRL